MRILITGGRGRTAQPIIHTLTATHHQITTFDITPPGRSPRVDAPTPTIHHLTGNIGRFADLLTAVPHHDAILHLAIAVGRSDYAQPDIPFATNVKGSYNLFEAARRNQIKRVILTSSAPVHLHHTTPINAHDRLPTSPGDDHLYDLTKRLQEEIARDFCESYSMTAVVLRLGHIVNGEDETDLHGRPLAQLSYGRGGWVSTTDVARACLHALTADLSGYHPFHIIGSYQAYEQYGIAHTEQTLGFKFQHHFEQYQ